MGKTQNSFLHLDQSVQYLKQIWVLLSFHCSNIVFPMVSEDQSYRASSATLNLFIFTISLPLCPIQKTLTFLLSPKVNCPTTPECGYPQVKCGLQKEVKAGTVMATVSLNTGLYSIFKSICIMEKLFVGHTLCQDPVSCQDSQAPLLISISLLFFIFPKPSFCPLRLQQSCYE